MSNGQATFTWYGHSCIELKTVGGKTVLFDPWFGNPTSPRAVDDVEACDVMLVTHGHHDHLGAGPGDVLSADALAIARRTKPVWPCIHELSLWLEKQLEGSGVEIIGMNKGGTVEAAGVKITMVHADHSAGDWSQAGDGPLYLGEAAGFVVEMEDGRRVLHSGDTEVFGDMALIREMYKPHMAFLPIGGHYTMGPAGAARAAQLLGVSVVVPIHYGTFPVLAGTPEQLRHGLTDRGLLGCNVIAAERGVETPLP
ncbi:MAG TPA: metal-dependent hydrolase [Candidatus Limnocylindria bacterium]|nr:metal-dependent hydrolase [Candidatus Limnocylindria bacterium]